MPRPQPADADCCGGNCLVDSFDRVATFSATHECNRWTQANPNLRAELEEDVAAECSKLGRIERLRVFAGNPEGVISIRYQFEEEAEACVKLMNGRFFGGQQIEAHMYGV